MPKVTVQTDVLDYLTYCLRKASFSKLFLIGQRQDMQSYRIFNSKVALVAHIVTALTLYEATITTKSPHCENVDRVYYTGKVL